MLAEARARAKQQKNLRPGEVLPCRESFANVATKFLDYQKPRLTPKAYEREAGIVAHFKVFFTGRLAEITSAQVSDYVTVRLGKVSKSSVRKELNSLKHLFRLVCGEWKLLARFSNPCLDVTAPKVRDERTQHLSPEQFRRVLAASPENMRPIFALIAIVASGSAQAQLVYTFAPYLPHIGEYALLVQGRTSSRRHSVYRRRSVECRVRRGRRSPRCVGCGSDGASSPR